MEHRPPGVRAMLSQGATDSPRRHCCCSALLVLRIQAQLGTYTTATVWSAKRPYTAAVQIHSAFAITSGRDCAHGNVRRPKISVVVSGHCLEAPMTDSGPTTPFRNILFATDF